MNTDIEKIAWMIGAAILSGLFATLISIFYQHRAEIKRRKNNVFETLMANRYYLASEATVRALNLVDVVFSSSKTIRLAYKEFLDETNRPEDGGPAIGDKFLTLLERIAGDLGLKNIQWDVIKRYYLPVGLLQRMNDETMLRKLQIRSAAQAIQQSAK